MEPAPRGGVISLAVVQRFVEIAADALSGAREEIDALNVYPVPDGDTGTNMFLTVSAARDAVRGALAEHGADAAALDDDRTPAPPRWVPSREVRCWVPGATPG